MGSAHRLKVCIAGSGIAGLTAARVLREHHDVAVFERGPLNVATGGQGIAMYPNGIRVLNELGFDTERVGICESTSFANFNKDGSIQDEAATDFNGRYGCVSWSAKRSDLREELFRLATAPSEVLGLSGNPATVHAETRVENIDPETGAVTLQDGSIVDADLVIVADGVHSRLRACLLGDQNHHTKKTGRSIFRLGVDKEHALQEFGELPVYWEPNSAGTARRGIHRANDGTGRMVMTYPCKRFEFINMSCVLPTPPRRMENPDGQSGSWFDEADQSQVVEKFADFPTVVNLLRLGTDMRVWDMQDLEPLPFWNKGRAIVIGDAAHAMTPLQGQGANQAIEDAEAFRLVRAGSTRDDVPGILAQIDSVRRPRTAGILASTRNVTPDTSAEERARMLEVVLQYPYIVKALEQKRLGEATAW